MNLNDIKVSTKIMAGFAILLIIGAAIGYIGYNSLKNAGERVEKFESAVHLQDMGKTIRGEAKNFIMVGDDYYGGRDETVMVYYNEYKNEIAQSIPETRAMFSRQQDIDEIDHLKEVFEEYGDSMQLYFEKYDAQKKAIDNMDSVAVKLMEVVNNLINDQGDKLAEEIAQGLSESQLASRDQLLKESNYIIDNVNAMRIHAKNIVLGRLDEAEDWRASLANAKKWTNTVKSKFSDQYNIEQANAILEQLDNYEKAGENYIKAESDLAEALAHAGTAGEEFDAVTRALEESQTKAMEAEQAKAITMIITFVIIAIIIGVLIALFITRAITKPVNKVASEAKKLAETGDLSMRATVMGKDEIGQMAESINLMLDNTAGPVQELSKVAEVIATGDLTVDVNVEAKGDIVNLIDGMKAMVSSLKTFIGEVTKNAQMGATTAEELSASAEEVNASTEQVSSTIQEISKGGQNLTKLAGDTKQVTEEVGKSAKQVAENAQKASEGAMNAGKLADEGMSSGKKAGSSMQQILESSKNTADMIKGLDDKSKEIGKIIDVINNVSEQTNLLALNAAIEAARAGEAGRGFAVVADEVRKLAEESQKATTQIADMITSIQNGTKTSVEQMTQSEKIVQEGSTVVQEAIASLEKIAEISKDVGSQIQEVSAAAQQSQAGVEQVKKAVDEVSGTAEESAASTEEVSASMEQTTSSMQQVSAAAQNMAKSADELRAMVSKFKVDDKSIRLGIVDLAVSDHTIFVRKLEDMAKGKHKIGTGTLPDHHTCRFGKWYDNEGKRDFGSNEAFKKVDTPHAKLHSLGSEAVKLYNEGKKEEAKKKVTEAESVSHDVISHLEELKKTG